MKPFFNWQEALLRREPPEGISPRNGYSPRDARFPVRGFSLIELIGVLAVMAILAATMAPAVLQEMDQAARTKEIHDLNDISNALVMTILSTNGTKTIPDATAGSTGWAQAVANWTRQPVAKILVNNRGCPRVFLVDTDGWFGTAAGALPYTQGITGTAWSNPPVNARVMIVSSIGRPQLPVVSGEPSTATFDAIWNTPDGAKPATWSGWQGKGTDLVIQRLNLESLFHRLILVNRDKLDAAPRYSIDSTNTRAVAYTNAAGLDAYYLDGTTVGLCDANGQPMLRFQLTHDVGYVFDANIWQTEISGGQSSEVMAQDFADLSAKFLAAQWYPGANHPGRGDQQGALTAMFNLMFVFSLWADQYPHYPTHGANAQQVPEYQLLNALVGPSTGGSSSDLLSLFTGANGLLNN